MRCRLLLSPTLRSVPAWSVPVWSVVVGVLATCVVGVAAAPAAGAAEEVFARPADGVFDVEGRGWGHGRGMSQWGAQGAASAGASAETIVRTYYPGTVRDVLAPAPIRVLLSGDEGKDTEVVAAPGLALTDVATGAVRPLPAGPDRWRVTVDAAGLRLHARTGGAWTPYAAVPPSAGPLRFSGPEFVRVVYGSGSSRDYRGAVQAVRRSASALQTVVVLPLEDYLLGVVPRESSSSWRPAALQAQAIAARSYSANKRHRVAGRGTYDICDTTACQVFGGSAVYTARGARTGLEPATTSEAVRATAGVVRTHRGVPIFAEFSSSNGGWSTRGDFPYLAAARDDWDGALPNPVHAWRASLRVADLERRFPAVGTLQRVRVTARDGNGAWGGRVRTVVLEGTSRTGAPTSVRTTGGGVYSARSWPASRDGLRSSWWRLLPEPGAPSAPPPAPSVAPAAPATPRLSAAAVGPVVAVAPRGSAAGPVLADGRTVVVPRGGSTEVQLAYRATGDEAWPAGRGTAVQLGTSSARNRGSSFAGAGWLSWARPGSPVSAADGSPAVQPGSTGVFRLRLHGNGRGAGTTVEAFEPLWAGRGWLDGAARRLVVVRVDPAVPRLAERHSSTSAVRLSAAAGERATLVVRLRNLGGSPWAVGSERLGTLGGRAFPLAAGWTGPSRPPALAANTMRPGATAVHPGEVGEWRLPVSAAGRRPGTYVLEVAAVGPAGRYGPAVRSTVTVTQ
jgi:SpoIID/LytB domain protein